MADETAALPACRKAIEYLLNRIQTDADVGYYCGPGTQVFFLLVMAEAELTGRPLADVETARQRDLTPAHRRREPEVEVLRRKLREARS